MVDMIVNFKFDIHAIQHILHINETSQFKGQPIEGVHYFEHIYCVLIYFSDGQVFFVTFLVFSPMY